MIINTYNILSGYFINISTNHLIGLSFIFVEPFVTILFCIYTTFEVVNRHGSTTETFWQLIPLVTVQSRDGLV